MSLQCKSKARQKLPKSHQSPSPLIIFSPLLQKPPPPSALSKHQIPKILGNSSENSSIPLPDFPSVKPSAIALGTFFNHGVDLVVLAPIFGQTYHRAKASNTKEEFIRSREAGGAAIAWGTSFVGSALQSYGVGALLNATGTLSHKGAAYLGALIFAATSAPSVSFLLNSFHHLFA